MQFVNLTPFGALAYRGIDARDREYHVFAMRTVYRLQHAHEGQQLLQDWFDPILIDEDAPGLVTTDEFVGELGRSSTRVESDLAPHKPHCDVLVSGRSHAPGGRPAKTWISRLRLSVPELFRSEPPPPPWLAEQDPDFEQRAAWQESAELANRPQHMSHGPDGQRAWQVMLDKSVRVHGPRRFERSALGRWSMGATQPAASVPLLWELAYGGACTVPDPAHARDPSRPEHLLNEVCYANPLGRGWWHADGFKAVKRAGLPVPDFLPAPQFEYPSDPIQTLDLANQAAGLDVDKMIDVVRGHAHQPAGFGPLGRPWTPRIQRAGHYDEAWLQQHWPGLPRDFDMRYWNCAPVDQQIAHPRPDLMIELGHLVDPALAPTGHAVVPMPGHRAAVLLHLKGGLLMCAACVIDTVHVDTDRMELALVWRASVSRDVAIDKAEMRFELEASKPLISVERDGRAGQELAAHG